MSATDPADELPDEIHSRIEALCAEGDRHAEVDDFERALSSYKEAWMILPEPKTQWNVATWILAAAADASFLSGSIADARAFIDGAMQCPDALGNPFLHLRRGEVLFEQGELDGAADELMRAYMGAGPDLFADEDPKYIRFLGTRALEIETPG